MSDTKRTVEEHEKKHGVIMVGEDVDLNEKLTDAEFLERRQGPAFVGVNHEDRIKFLEDNGYPVTRENMIDSSLSAVTGAPAGDDQDER